MNASNLAVKPLRRADLRRISRNMRKMTGVDDYENFCVVHWLETKFLPMADFTLDVRDEEFMGENHGLTDHASKTIYLRDDVYEGACAGVGRDRMTVVHEAAHCLIHTPDRVVYSRNFGDLPRWRDPEWQAKALAGEFLVPAHLIAANMDEYDVSEKFGVSVEAARFQIGVYERDGLL